MPVQTFVLGPLMVNTYLFTDASGTEGILIDPAGDSPALAQALEGIALKAIINTHGHFDHIAANGLWQERTGAPVAIHELDAPMLADPLLNLSASLMGAVDSPAAAILFKGEMDSFAYTGGAFQVLRVPGHSPGSVALYEPAQGLLFAGDLIFAGAVGRTDFPGGSQAELAASVRRILDLPGTTRVYPGHDEDFTLSEYAELLGQIALGDTQWQP